MDTPTINEDDEDLPYKGTSSSPPRNQDGPRSARLRITHDSETRTWVNAGSLKIVERLEVQSGLSIGF